MPESEPICARSYEHTLGGERREIVVRIWRPVPRDDSQEYFECRFEIEGLPEPVGANAAGVDSMQALVCAMQGVHFKLRSLGKSLTFMDAPYEEFGQIVIGEIDPGRRRRIFEILDEEEYAQNVLFERRREAIAVALARGKPAK